MENETLTLREILSRIDFSNPAIKSEVAWDSLAEALDMNKWGLWFQQDRLTAYFIEKWYCTDTFVGLEVYFLDNLFVAMSEKPYRKAKEVFYFVSTEAATKVRDYIASLIVEEEPELEVETISLDESFPALYKIEYNTQILHRSAFYKGEKVKIIQKNFQKEGINSPNYFHSVKIEIQKGVERIVDCRDLRFDRFSLD